MSTPKSPAVKQSFQNILDGVEFAGNLSTEARRREARGKMIVAEMENSSLSRDNRELAQEVEDLRQKNEALETRLDAVSALAKSRFVDSEALRKTIVHMEKAWGRESPKSPALAETSQSLDTVHREAYTEIWNDPETTKKFNDQVKISTERQKAKRRISPR